MKGRAALPWHERIELDLWYIEHWSLRLDLRILAETGSAAGHAARASTAGRPEAGARRRLATPLTGALSERDRDRLGAPAEVPRVRGRSRGASRSCPLRSKRKLARARPTATFTSAPPTRRLLARAEPVDEQQRVALGRLDRALRRPRAVPRRKTAAEDGSERAR